MNKRTFYVLFVFAIAIGSLSRYSYACQCLPLPPIYEAYRDADAVFVGKVVGSNVPVDPDHYAGGDIIFDIEVVESLKGVTGSKVRLNRGSMGSSCYSGYSTGEVNLYYASKSPDFGFFENKISGEDVVYQGSFCHRTTSLRSAQDQLLFLREMKEGKPESQIYGSVARSDSDPLSGEWRTEYFKGVKVQLMGAKTFTAVTDAKGIFRFNHIPSGQYILRAQPSINYTVTSYPSEETLTVLPDGSVANDDRLGQLSYSAFYSDIRLGWNNHIDGNVRDVDGRALDRYVIQMLPSSKADEEMIPQYRRGSPDASMKDGFFLFGRRSPGKYLLAVEVYVPSSAIPKRRFFYPGTVNASSAQVFDIGPTTNLKNLQLKVPFKQREVRGHIVWSDGTSVGERGNATLSSLENIDDPANVALDWSGVTRDGWFELQAFEGFEYWIQPSITYFTTKDTGHRFTEIRAKPIKLKIEEKMDELKIVVDKPTDFSCERINSCGPDRSN